MSPTTAAPPSPHDRARRAGPVEVGHLQIHQDDVGAQLGREPDSLLAAGRLADHPQLVADREDGGYELVLLLGASAAAIFVAGAGRVSLDRPLHMERVPSYRWRRCAARCRPTRERCGG